MTEKSFCYPFFEDYILNRKIVTVQVQEHNDGFIPKGCKCIWRKHPFLNNSRSDTPSWK